MKKLERIFLYSMLAILFFYVFLVDGNVESQVAIQEEIRAKRIVIVNNEGQEVVSLFPTTSGGAMEIYNKDGETVVGMGVNEYGNGVMGFFNKAGIRFVDIGALENGGGIRIKNKAGTVVAIMEANESLNGAGVIGVFNKAGIDVVNISTSIDDSGGILFYNKTGDCLAFMGAYENKNGTISLFDKYGKLIGSIP